jgi:hypothetical protein
MRVKSRIANRLSQRLNLVSIAVPRWIIKPGHSTRVAVQGVAAPVPNHNLLTTDELLNLF